MKPRPKSGNALGTNQGVFQNHFNHFQGDQTGFLHYKPNNPGKQCKTKSCRSEDLRFSEAGYCLRCLQRIEFIRRERPDFLTRFISGVSIAGGLK